jgi:hypothetical protein
VGVVAAAIGSLAVGSVAQAAPAYSGPQLLWSSPVVLRPGQATWVQAYWRTWTDVCDVAITADAPGVDVGYPSNTGTYSSFYRQASLAAGESDYTAFRLTVTGKGSRTVPLRLRVSYVQLPHDVARPGGPITGCQGPAQERTVTAPLMVLDTPA